LNPAFINSGDYLDLSLQTAFRIRFQVAALQTDRVLIGYYKRMPFPDHSTGFLYYHRDWEAAPLEGSVRLRIASDNTPSSFLSGQDLFLPSGSPWKITLPQLACHENYTQIRDQLLSENLATEEELSQCRNLFADRRLKYPEYILFRFTQEFPVTFHRGGIRLTVVGETLHQIGFSAVFQGSIVDKQENIWNGTSLDDISS
jgi:hypothetical protein